MTINTQFFISILVAMMVCAHSTATAQAEYLYQQKKISETHFHLTNGFNVDYIRWSEGYRVKVSGNKTEWIFKTAELKEF